MRFDNIHNILIWYSTLYYCINSLVDQYYITATCYNGEKYSKRACYIMHFCCRSSARVSVVQVAQWFSALAAMAMLSPRSWVRVPPTTSEVFRLYLGFSTQQSNPNAKICAMCLNKLAQSHQGLHVKQATKKIYKPII